MRQIHKTPKMSHKTCIRDIIIIFYAKRVELRQAEAMNAECITCSYNRPRVALRQRCRWPQKMKNLNALQDTDPEDIYLSCEKEKIYTTATIIIITFTTTNSNTPLLLLMIVEY